MLKKNEIIPLEITAVTSEGSGVGRYEGIAVFVPDTCTGDKLTCRIVKTAKSYCYGRAETVTSPSPDRLDDTGCEVSVKCGGCCLRHMTYEAECREKQRIAADAFERIGGLNPEQLPMLAAENDSRYRNKAQFPVSQDENGRLYFGFYARRSHRVIGNGDCLLLPEIFINIANDMLDICTKHNITAYNEETSEGELRHIYLRQGFHSGEIMAAFIAKNADSESAYRKAAEVLCEKYPQIKSFQLNINPERTNVILGKKTVVLKGSDCISDIMCGRKVSISLHSFYQINTAQAERVYACAAELAQLRPTDTLLDLYCGAGTIGLSMADRVKKLIGVEIIPQAIENARENAALNGFDNTEFICSDAGKAAKLLAERGERPDVVIADPARKGCTPDTLEAIAQMSPRRIVMISCNPATAARDCAALEKLGYKTLNVRAADLFPRTQHVECVILLTRLKNI